MRTVIGILAAFLGRRRARRYLLHHRTRSPHRANVPNCRIVLSPHLARVTPDAAIFARIRSDDEHPPERIEELTWFWRRLCRHLRTA